MRSLAHSLGVAIILLACTGVGRGQSPAGNGQGPAPPGTGGATSPPGPAPAAGPAAAREMEVCLREIEGLRRQQVAMEAGAQDDEQKKRIEILQKEIATLEKMVKLLAEQLKKEPGGPALEKVQAQTATLESRATQAARRDQELAGALSDLLEHDDAQERAWPRLPATLKELFLPTQTNETPLSIYGQFLFGYHQLNGTPGQFATPDFSPYFLLFLNQRFFLEANIDINNTAVTVAEAQLDWLVTDWLTVVAGRYITPIGFFNERLNHEWINRLPDVPLMFLQVSPLIDTDGIQFRGSCYLGCTPVKLEYSLYGGNGFQLASAPTGVTGVADLGALTGGPDEVDAKALGGRVGIWIPALGVQAGVSGYYQNEYAPSTPNDFRLWGFDLNYRKGNWDARFEFAQAFQQATAFIGNDIVRTGLYAQVAYRDYNHPCRLVSNLEVVARYSMARFRGIDQTQLDPTAFSSPVNLPVDRDQYTFGINYYFYPSLVLRFAYEINHQLGIFRVNDNQFLSQLVFAF
jgi:hypothetical protein